MLAIAKRQADAMSCQPRSLATPNAFRSTRSRVRSGKRRSFASLLAPLPTRTRGLGLLSFSALVSWTVVAQTASPKPKASVPLEPHVDAGPTMDS
jgi:hypothetical protein